MYKILIPSTYETKELAERHAREIMAKTGIVCLLQEFADVEEVKVNFDIEVIDNEL